MEDGCCCRDRNLDTSPPRSSSMISVQEDWLSVINIFGRHGGEFQIALNALADQSDNLPSPHYPNNTEQESKGTSTDNLSRVHGSMQDSQNTTARPSCKHRAAVNGGSSIDASCSPFFQPLTPSPPHSHLQPAPRQNRYPKPKHVFGGRTTGSMDERRAATSLFLEARPRRRVEWMEARPSTFDHHHHLSRRSS